MTDPTPRGPATGPAGPGTRRPPDRAHAAGPPDRADAAGPPDRDHAAGQLLRPDATGPPDRAHAAGPTGRTGPDDATATPPAVTGQEGIAAEPRRPLLMDPAGARPTGFAPPTGSTTATGPNAATGATAATGPNAATGSTVSAALVPPASPWAPVAGARPRPTPPLAPSRLAATSLGGSAEPAPGWPAAPEDPRPESAFGPVSRIVPVSIRTPTARIDLVLPERTTAAEVLETVLNLAPRSLREQALAHGGWILRTAAGRPLTGSATLLDEAVTAGDTLVLAGADTRAAAVVHDDPADAVADAVRADTRAWPAGAGRVVALAACGAFGLLAILAAPALGPPWTPPALVLAGLALAAQLAAGLLARRRGDAAAAVTIGLLSVPAGAAGAALATAAGLSASGSPGGSPLGAAGPLPWLVGLLAAGVLAGTASVAIGSHRVAFGAVVTAAGLLVVAAVPALAVGLSVAGVAALVTGLAVCLMPAAPSVALRLAAFEPEPLPGSAADLEVAARRTLDGADTRSRARRAIRLLTALLHGLAWPVLGAGIVLAVAAPPAAGPALAAVAGTALLLRARLFRTVGQRVPLVVAGVGGLLAAAGGLVLHASSSWTVLLVVVVAAAAAGTAAVLAGRHRPRTAGMARAAEVADLLLAIAVIPLTAAAVGAFAVIRGLGG